MKQFQMILFLMALISYINSQCSSNLDVDDIVYDDVDLDVDDEDLVKQINTLNYDTPYEPILNAFVDPSASSSNCHSRGFSSSEISSGAYKCCHLKGRCLIENPLGGNRKFITDIDYCEPVDKKTFDSLKNYSKDLEAECNYLKMDCNSSYLKFAFLSLIIILL